MLALVDGAWNALILAGAAFGLAGAYALCDHYIDVVLRQGEADRQRPVAPEIAMTGD